MTDKMKHKLKPCPFCGGEAYEYYTGLNFELCQVICKECGSKTARIIAEESIALWNTRKPMDKIVDELEELAMEHPYKVVGEPDTYSQYNEAWSNCCDRAEQIVEGVQNEGI